MTDTRTLYMARFNHGNKLTVVSVKAIETKAQFRILDRVDGVYRTRIDKCNIGTIMEFSGAWDYTAKQALMVLLNDLYKKNATMRERIDENITLIDILKKEIEATDD